MTETIDKEKIILTELQTNEDYARKVLPYIKSEYFLDTKEKHYFDAINSFFSKYNSLPTKEALKIYFSSLKIKQDEFDGLCKYADDVELLSKKKQDQKWLIETTETFCKDQSLYLALQQALEVADGADKNLSKTSIPSILQKALAVTFDPSIGHNYLSDSTERFNYYHDPMEKIPFRLETLNKITKNGVKKKTVQCIAAGTGIGKSMLMCHLAADYLLDGASVLYISLEMAEKELAKRIDANLMDISVDDIEQLPIANLQTRFNKLSTKAKGKLIIKEYPNGSAHVGHFKFLLDELKSKQNFIPDVIFIDYMNICASQRIKNRSDMYTYVKSIAEELRAFAQECDLPIWTATQLNRSGQSTTDVDLTNISESMGGPMTFDLLLALVSNEELAALDQVLVIQLKNRYADVFKYKKFNLGVDRGKMKFYDLTNNTQVINVNQPPQQPKAKQTTATTTDEEKPAIKI